jgi:DNA polymerase
MGRVTASSEARRDWEAAHDRIITSAELAKLDVVDAGKPARTIFDMPTCMVDFETRSYLSIKDTGAWRYAEDASTEILCMGWKFVGTDIRGLWVPGVNEFPKEVIDHIKADGMFEAHNVQFERAIWILILHRRFGIPIPKFWKDTLAACAHRGIPLSLDDAGRALNLPIQKDKRGKYLLQTLCIPKWGTKKEPDRVYREDWDLMQELYDYCDQDVDSEECLGETIGDLPPAEYGLWMLDQRINQRGVQLDIDAVQSALEVISIVEDKLNTELRGITNNQVEKATQRDRLIKWFHSRGLSIPNLTKETIEDLLKVNSEGLYVNLWNVGADVIRALEIRVALAKSSTKKLEKMMQTVSQDGRIRGLLQYHGASTGRWAGRLVQPQNFPRSLIKEKMDTLVDMIKRKDYETLDYLYGSTSNEPRLGSGSMNAISSSLRGMFIAKPEHVMHVCDFSAIEARVTFWVADCMTGLEVFHTSDRKESEDIYCVTASDLVGFEVKKALHSHERQLGKITVLGCGYQMGWSKLQFQAEKDYNTIVSDEQAQQMVNLYRTKYKEVPWLWYGLQEAAIETVKTGHPHSYRKIVYELVDDAAGRWLTCILPNGRRLWYYQPVVERAETSWGEMRDALSYMGRDNKKSGAWGRIRTYGGMLTENVVQAIARDLMAEAMIRVEKAGFPIILTVHDEIISETLKGTKDQKEFERIMAICPDWAKGCPIAVEGGVITRYQKV